MLYSYSIFLPSIIKGEVLTFDGTGAGLKTDLDREQGWVNSLTLKLKL